MRSFAASPGWATAGSPTSTRRKATGRRGRRSWASPARRAATPRPSPGSRDATDAGRSAPERADDLCKAPGDDPVPNDVWVDIGTDGIGRAHPGPTANEDDVDGHPERRHGCEIRRLEGRLDVGDGDPKGAVHASEETVERYGELFGRGGQRLARRPLEPHGKEGVVVVHPHDQNVRAGRSQLREDVGQLSLRRPEAALQAARVDAVAVDTLIHVVRADIDRHQDDAVRLQEIDRLSQLTAPRVFAEAPVDHRRGRLARAAELDHLEPGNPRSIESIEIVDVPLVGFDVGSARVGLDSSRKRVTEREVVGRRANGGGGGLHWACRDEGEKHAGDNRWAEARAHIEPPLWTEHS